MKTQFNRILLIRTDRIGDVLLSTPVLANLRKALPRAYIAIMVQPYAKDIVEGNPNIDEVIIYDKQRSHKSWLASIRFALNLRKRKFDLALILHPTNRSHIISFLAGIRLRIGYNKKLPFLLTEKIAETKFKGEKHERDYALDMLLNLGIQPQLEMPFMPLRQESEVWAEKLLRNYKLDKAKNRLIAVHPGASCPSKRWPIEHYAAIIKELIQKKSAKFIIIGGSENIKLSQRLIELINPYSAIDLTGKTTLSQLASLLKRCSLFISNDSGPVHIASALRTPVISIFGRNEAGLSPRRWGPLGKEDKLIHKDVGCEVCLAHNCDKHFLCLSSIKPEEITSLAMSFL